MDNIDETETATNAIVAESNIDLAIGNTTSYRIDVGDES